MRLFWYQQGHEQKTWLLLHKTGLGEVIFRAADYFNLIHRIPRALTRPEILLRPKFCDDLIKPEFSPMLVMSPCRRQQAFWITNNRLRLSFDCSAPSAECWRQPYFSALRCYSQGAITTPRCT